MDKLYRWLLLRNVKGVGERTLKVLWEKLGSSENILTASLSDLEEIVGRTKARAIHTLVGTDPKRVEDTIRLLEREGIRALTLEDEYYPRAFRRIPDPPPVVFYRGRISDTSLVGIVGARKPTSYSLVFTEELAKKAVSAGYGVVSGGARGIDSKAHIGAIESSGYTLCVLGFGILKARGGIFERILSSGGCLISEFLPEEEADKFTFPKRNRLIAVLSEMVIIPEAGAKSGALITANYAVSYGVPLYVHIGIGRSPNWEGCYRLVKEGKAQLFRDPEELFSSKVCPEDDLLGFLQVPRTLDEILTFAGKSATEVMNKLLSLEVEGKIKKTGAYYMRV